MRAEEIFYNFYGGNGHPGSTFYTVSVGKKRDIKISYATPKPDKCSPKLCR